MSLPRFMSKSAAIGLWAFVTQHLGSPLSHALIRAAIGTSHHIAPNARLEDDYRSSHRLH